METKNTKPAQQVANQNQAKQPTSQTQTAQAGIAQANTSSQGATQVNTPQQQPSPSDIKKRLAEDKAKFEETKLYYKTKEKKIKSLEQIEDAILNLQALRADNKEFEEPTSCFEKVTQNMKITVETYNGNYNRYENAISLNSPQIVDEIFVLMLNRLTVKAATLRAEILA